MDTHGPHPSFRDLLRQHRTAAGLSQEKLAERSGLSTRAVSDLERGVRRAPRLETVRMLSDALGLGMEERTGLLHAARLGRGAHEDEVVTRTPAAAFRLPLPPTPLVGREREIAALCDLLTGDMPRLVTLTGPGGVGKTRLAIDAARRAAGAFEDGVLFIDLGAVAEPDMVARAIADVLQPSSGGGPESVADIARSIGEKHVLLVLDNFEHVVEAAPFVAMLLAQCPALRVMVTSRVPLRVRGERQFPVPALRAPDPHHVRLDDVLGADAVRLFVDRATDARPDFSIDEDTAGDVAAICRRLDGIPLALELAAVRVRILSPHELLSRLERSLPLLTGGPVDLPGRHQTLRATIEWSHELLEPEARVVFRRLAIFAGGFTLEAAEAVVDPEGELDVLEALLSLVNKNMVRSTPGTTGQSRYTMLETIREFGREMLAAADEETDARKAHGTWMLDLVERAGPALVGRDQAIWLTRLENEVENLRAALAWAIVNNDSETALRLAAVPWLFWFEHGRASEGRDWLARALALAPDGLSAARAEALYAAASLAATQADYAEAELLLESAIGACNVLNDAAGLARATQILGTVMLDQDHNEKAARLFERVLSGYDVPPDAVDAPWVALAHSQLAAALSRLGNRQRALALATDAVERQREAGSAIGVALGLAYLGEIALDWGDRADARTRFRESLTILRQHGDRWYLLYVLTGLITVLAYEEPPQRAARLFGAETAARVFYRHVAPPRFRKTYDAAVAHLRSRLGDEAFLELQAEGATLSLYEAVAEALRE